MRSCKNFIKVRKSFLIFLLVPNNLIHWAPVYFLLFEFSIDLAVLTWHRYGCGTVDGLIDCPGSKGKGRLVFNKRRVVVDIRTTFQNKKIKELKRKQIKLTTCERPTSLSLHCRKIKNKNSHEFSYQRHRRCGLDQIWKRQYRSRANVLAKHIL